MGDDQIGPDILPRLKGLVDSVRMPDGVLKATGAVVIRAGRAGGRAVGNSFHAAKRTIPPLSDKTTTPAVLAGEFRCNEPKLARKVRVSEYDMHRG